MKTDSSGQPPEDAPPPHIEFSTEERADHSIQQYRDIFEAASDGLVVNDLTTGIVLEANPAFCRMHGYDDMAGLHPSTFIHPGSQPIFVEYVDAIRAGREYRARAKDIRRDGSIFDVEVLGRPMTYNGQPAMLGVVRDISEEVRTYHQLEERIAERTAEIQRRRKVAEALQDLLAVVNSRQSLQEILEYMAVQSRRLLGSDASALFMPVDEPGVELLDIRASDGLTPEHSTVRMPFRISSTGLAYIRRKPVVVANLPAVLPLTYAPNDTLQLNEQAGRIDIVRLPSLLEHPNHDPEATQVAGMRSFAQRFGAFLAVPLALDDASYGTLSLYYFEPRDFNDDDIALASTFARQAALAIENAQLREQAGKAAAVEERQRLARELHDAVTQTLFSASLISEVIPDLWETNPDEARRRLQQLRRLTRGALAEMRLLLVELRPNALTDMPLADLIKQLIDAASGSIRAEIQLDVGGHYRTSLTPEAQIAFYRIAQEALNNISKHSHARNVRIALECQGESVQMTIEDDGLGFDLAAIPTGHFGVGIMAERAEDVCAALDVWSAPGAGTKITVEWPKPEESAC
ncbi:MAG TPA: PAS domain S-box protein [Nitrolancea sp.]|nr:PAS domain S-box protein [Nitrolancea sp.]